jgi:hypothetical protein
MDNKASLPDASVQHILSLRRNYVSPAMAASLEKITDPDKLRFKRPASKYTPVEMQLMAETRWLTKVGFPFISTDKAEAIATGEENCPWCGHNIKEYGFQREAEIIVEGETTGLEARRIVLCRCTDFKRFYARWHQMIPEAYQGFTLQSLTPSRKQCRLAVGVQQKIIDGIKKHPDWSYLIIGRAGVSKSVYSTCLFWRALNIWMQETSGQYDAPDSCWYISANEYLTQCHDYSISRESTYTVKGGVKGDHWGGVKGSQ